MRTDNVLKGLTYAGKVTSRSGRVIPVYEIAEETADSWNAMARKAFLRLYMQEHSAPPDDFEAAYEEHLERVTDLTERIRKETGPAPAIPIIRI